MPPKEWNDGADRPAPNEPRNDGATGRAIPNEGPNERGAMLRPTPNDRLNGRAGAVRNAGARVIGPERCRARG